MNQKQRNKDFLYLLLLMPREKHLGFKAWKEISFGFEDVWLIRGFAQ